MRLRSLAVSLSVIVSIASMRDAEAVSPYAIDGLRLGSSFTRERGFQCKPSEQFADSIFCRRDERRGRSSSITKVLHDRTGTLGYASREVRPAFFSGNDISNEIKRLSTRFGPVAREIRLPDRENLGDMRIAIWGELELEEIPPGQLREAHSPRAQTVLIDHLGDIERSRRLGLPIYRLKGGPGFLWSAASDEDGHGRLRFLFFDVGVLTGTKVTRKEVATPPAQSTPVESAAATSPALITASVKEAGSGKLEKKRAKAEDRLPQATDDDMARAAEQRRIAAAERMAAAERDKARLAWDRYEAEKASREARERMTWMVALLSMLLFGIFALIHRMQQPELQTSTLRRLRELGSSAKARLRVPAVQQSLRSLTEKLIARGHAVLSRSQSLIASHPRS
jgi:hypothetical protein